MDNRCVALSTRKTKKGRSYHLRWFDSTTNQLRSRSVGGDKKRAEAERTRLEDRINEGTHHDVRKIGWKAFTDDHVGKLEGTVNASEARFTLEEFGRVIGPTTPRAVRYGDAERFVKHLKGKGNAHATVNKRLRYLRAAFNAAIRRGFASVNPIDSSLMLSVDHKVPRVASEADEVRLLDAASILFGEQWVAFVKVALATGGRKGELLGLSWDRITVDGDETSVVFTHTKGKRDRTVPITADLTTILCRIKIKTLVDGGPFRKLGCVERKWGQIVTKSGVKPITLHDLRRTFCTRLIRAGTPLPTVQRLAGHRQISTTIEHYNETSTEDLRAGIERMRKHFG